ncbi:MAG TPA: hypothetical protein ENJ95_00750, partial [Bacteroidetes bacterium]|nr:hypothetical protein [Bacteroidota bacterium]
MNKLQAYFKYFDKYHGVEDWDWYKSSKYWISISQDIKIEVSKTDFSNVEAIKELLVNIINDKSNSKLKSIKDFCQR